MGTLFSVIVEFKQNEYLQWEILLAQRVPYKHL